MLNPSPSLNNWHVTSRTSSANPKRPVATQPWSPATLDRATNACIAPVARPNAAGVNAESFSVSQQLSRDQPHPQRQSQTTGGHPTMVPGHVGPGYEFIAHRIPGATKPTLDQDQQRRTHAAISCQMNPTTPKENI